MQQARRLLINLSAKHEHPTLLGFLKSPKLPTLVMHTNPANRFRLWVFHPAAASHSSIRRHLCKEQGDLLPCSNQHCHHYQASKNSCYTRPDCMQEGRARLHSVKVLFVFIFALDGAKGCQGASWRTPLLLECVFVLSFALPNVLINNTWMNRVIIDLFTS